jgi:hypothetical protein
MFGGMKITVSTNATARTLRWPEKKRSRRLIKKMTKRLGPQVYMKPAMFETQYGLIVHPEIYAELQRATRKEKR